MAADKTGIPCAASGYHDDSTLWALSADGGWEMTGAGFQLFKSLDRQTVASRHWWQTLCSTVLYPHPSFLPPSLSLPLPACSTAAVLQNKSRDKCRSVTVSMDTRGLLQRLLQSLFTHAIVLEDNGFQTHAPLVLPPTTHYHTTRLSRLSWQMLSEACTYTQNTLCLHLMGCLGLKLIWRIKSMKCTFCNEMIFIALKAFWLNC